ANGAAILAAHLSKSFDTSIQNIRLLDVIPRSLGTDLYQSKKDKNGYYNIVAKRNTSFPFELKSECTTLYANQDEMEFVVYEGDEEEVTKNKKLGNFTLMNILPGRQGIPKIEINFRVDENAILTVSAVDKRNGSSESLQIVSDKGRLTDAEIIQMSREIQSYPEEIVID
uniref:Heat shock protein 70 n=1 Tax=Panagrolaimus sp. ES5 TaxID=591445 RepID=A0AC34GG72_9BILA